MGSTQQQLTAQLAQGGDVWLRTPMLGMSRKEEGAGAVVEAGILSFSTRVTQLTGLVPCFQQINGEGGMRREMPVVTLAFKGPDSKFDGRVLEKLDLSKSGHRKGTSPPPLGAEHEAENLRLLSSVALVSTLFEGKPGRSTGPLYSTSLPSDPAARDVVMNEAFRIFEERVVNRLGARLVDRAWKPGAKALEVTFSWEPGTARRP